MSITISSSAASLLSDDSVVTMRYIKDQADCSQIMVVIGFCPAVLSAWQVIQSRMTRYGRLLNSIMLITQTAFVCPPLLSAWLLLAVAVASACTTSVVTS